MRGITITYTYDGDEAAWRDTVTTFINAIEKDDRLAGRLLYQVAVADDGKTRFHWGRWDSAETLAHLQAQDFFKTFAGKVQAFAENPPAATGHDTFLKTAGW